LTGKKAFDGDYDVFHYSTSQETPTKLLSLLPTLTRALLVAFCFPTLIDRYPSERPSVRGLKRSLLIPAFISESGRSISENLLDTTMEIAVAKQRPEIVHRLIDTGTSPRALKEAALRYAM